MFCTRCGMKCRDDARFCPRCGQQLVIRTRDFGPDQGKSGQMVRPPDVVYPDRQDQVMAGHPVKNAKKKHTMRNVLIILAVVAAMAASGGSFVFMSVQPRHVLDTFLTAAEEEDWPALLDCIEWDVQADISREGFEGYLKSRTEEIRQWSGSTKVRYKKEDRGKEKTSVTVMISKKGMQLADPEREIELVRSGERRLLFFKEWKLTPQSAALLLEG